jgi:flagellar capping protein FliD
MTFRSALVLFAFASLALLPSCASKDAVSISGTVTSASIAVAQPNGLVTTVSGSFDLFLQLGARASDATDVGYTSFSLLKASDNTTVLSSPLSVMGSAPSPVHINPGESATVHFTVGASSTKPQETAKGDYASACAAGPLVLTVTITDSANGGQSQSISSSPFTPSGCP